VLHTTKVKDFMSHDVHVVKEQSLISEAANTLEGQQIRHLPVISVTGQVIGIISDRDIRSAKVVIDLFNLAAGYGGQLTVEKIGTSDFAHSNTISVLDRHGTIVHQQLRLSDGVENTVEAALSSRAAI